MKVVINSCFGGFGLSEKAYEKLIEWGVPVRKYIQQERNPETLLWDRQPLNEGEIIFDRLLAPPEERDKCSDALVRMGGRYWETWTEKERSHPSLIRVVEELGKKANGRCASLKIVEIPDDVDYEIAEYDGCEHIAEKHRTWE